MTCDRIFVYQLFTMKWLIIVCVFQTISNQNPIKQARSKGNCAKNVLETCGVDFPVADDVDENETSVIDTTKMKSSIYRCARKVWRKWRKRTVANGYQTKHARFDRSNYSLSLQWYTSQYSSHIVFNSRIILQHIIPHCNFIREM